MANQQLGQWTDFNFTLSGEATKVFHQAMEGFVGVTYTPLAVATQVVAGLNYCYLCKGVVATSGSPERAAKIYIYAPPSGKPHITNIITVSPALAA